MTTKELLDEQIEDFKTDFPAMEGYLDTEVREGMIRMLKDSQQEIIKELEASIRNEVVEDLIKTIKESEVESNNIDFVNGYVRANNDNIAYLSGGYDITKD